MTGVQTCALPISEVVAEDSVNTALIKEAIAKQGYGVGRIETVPYEKHGLFPHKR